MNEYIDLYVNQYNVKVSNLKDNSKFRLYVTDELNKEINDKYGIKVDRIDISFK